MSKVSKKYLLQIEPKGKKSAVRCNDKLTQKMRLLLKYAKEGRHYKGWHTCSCGERGGSCDLHIKGYITNSLAVHYLEWHRKDVPEKEIAKLKSIKPRSKGR
jgi:hypothetical protein